MQVGQNRYNTKHGTVSFRLNRDVSVVQCFSTTLQQREKHWQRIKGATENFAENCTYFLLFLCKLQPATRYVYKICHKLFLNLDFTVVGNLRFVLGYRVHPTDCITSTDLLQMSLSICPNIKIMKCSSVPWITLHRFTVGIMVLIQQKRSSPITTTVFKQRDWGLLFQPSHKKNRNKWSSLFCRGLCMVFRVSATLPAMAIQKSLCSPDRNIKAELQHKSSRPGPMAESQPRWQFNAGYKKPTGNLQCLHAAKPLSAS